MDTLPEGVPLSSLSGGSVPPAAAPSGIAANGGAPSIPEGVPLSSLSGGTAVPPPSQAPLTPYNFKLDSYDVPTLKQAYTASGGNAALVPDEAWQQLSQRYQDASNPSMLGKVQAAISQSGIGHFAGGFFEGLGTDLKAVLPDSMTNSDLAASIKNITPDAAKEVNRADGFFNQNIQAHIIDGGKYVDENGNYSPPLSTQTGKAAGIIAPAAAIAIPAAAEYAGPLLAAAKAHPVVSALAGAAAVDKLHDMGINIPFATKLLKGFAAE